jgi:hypothetical protein
LYLDYCFICIFWVIQNFVGIWYCPPSQACFACILCALLELGTFLPKDSSHTIYRWRRPPWCIHPWT